MTRIPFMTLMVLLAVGCASSEPAQKGDNWADEESGGSPVKAERVLQAGEIVEAVSADKVLVKCSGLGAANEDAVLNARLGCLDWFVRTQILHQPAEQEAFLKAREAFFVQIDRYVENPLAATGGSGIGLKARTTDPDTQQVRVTLIASLMRSPLEQELQAQKIWAGSPLKKVKAVVAVGKLGKGLRVDMIRNLAAQFLIDRGLEVLAPPADADGTDPVGLVKQTGADVAVSVEVILQKASGGVAAAVNLQAVDGTGRQFGTAVVMGPARAGWQPGAELKAVEEPMRDALTQLLTQVEASLARR